MIKAVKGFHRDMTCKTVNGTSMQFKKGEKYTIPVIKGREKGFNAFELPINVFRHYSPATSVYHEIEMSGNIDHSIYCMSYASEITIGREISIAEIIDSSISLINKDGKYIKKT